MNAPPRGITPCQGPVLLGTCAHQDLWLLGDTSAPLWYPLTWRDLHRDSSVSHWAQGQLSVLLGNNFMPLSDTGTAQCPHWAQGQLCPHWAWGQLSVPESALCPHWAGDSWNGCVTPRSMTLLVVLSPPHPTGGLGWCWGTDGHSGDPESHHGPVAWAHWCPLCPAVTQKGINSSSVTSCHMPSAGRPPAPSRGHSCSWEREGWPRGHSIPPALPPQGPPHRPRTVPRGHTGVQAVPVGHHCHCPGNTDPNPAWGRS